jgi:hypothetical protein
MRHRTLGLAALLAALLVALIGARQLLITKMPGSSFRGALPALSPEQIDLRGRLKTHVETLAVGIGERNMFRYPALLRAAQYIDETLAAAGHQPRSQEFEVRGKPVRNIEIEITGAEPNRGVVVVGAHYDSVDGSPGANDNGTGVAAVLELARTLKDRRPRRSVRLVAFVNEEPPFSYTDAMGSVRYATRLADAGETSVAMLSLETIGYYSDDPGSQRYPFPLSFFYPDTGNFIGFVGNLRSMALVRRATKSFREHARFPSEGLAAPRWLTGIGWSDHWSFWQAGYPAIMVTDSALFRYAEYHSRADLPGVVDYDRFARVVDGLAGVVIDLADGERPERQ